MSKRNALVTGANRGIGREIARQLGEHGFAVWLGCRDREKGEAAAKELRGAGIEADAVVIDVADDDSVREAAAYVGGRITALDALVNNAGMNFGPPPPASGESLDDIRAMFETNTFGPLRVTQAFLPLLRKAKEARIVMATSGLGSIESTLDMTSENWTVGFAGYSASKTALNMFTVKLAKELAPEGIKVNCADPGLSNTELGGYQGKDPKVSAGLAVRLATLPWFGPTGGFFRDDGPDTRPPRQPW